MSSSARRGNTKLRLGCAGWAQPAGMSEGRRETALCFWWGRFRPLGHWRSANRRWAWDLVCPLRLYRRRAFPAFRWAEARKGGLCHPPLQSPALPAVWACGFPRRPRRAWGTLSTCSRHGDNWLGIPASPPRPLRTPRPDRGEPDPVSRSAAVCRLLGLSGLILKGKCEQPRCQTAQR